MKPFTSVLALLVVLATLFVPAVAQGPKAGPGSGPERDGIAGMMTMMGDMQDRMKQMQEQMEQMQGQMTGMMQQHRAEMRKQMTGMMQRHHADMQKSCPGAAAPQPPKQGG